MIGNEYAVVEASSSLAPVYFSFLGILTVSVARLVLQPRVDSLLRGLRQMVVRPRAGVFATR